MNYTLGKISQIALKNPEDIKTPDILKLSFDEKIKLTQHPNTSQETLAILTTDEDNAVRCGVAQHPNTPQETLGVLSTDKESYVRREVALNPNTSQELLKSLATDENWIVRYWVARHPNATELIRRLVLMTDDEQNS